MSEHNAESNGSRAADAVSGGIGQVQDHLGEAAARASGKFDSARQSTADRLHDAADTVRGGGDVVAGAAHSAAEKLASSATYLESHDARGMARHLIEIVKKHPGRSVLIAGVLGFFVARAVRATR